MGNFGLLGLCCTLDDTFFLVCLPSLAVRLAFAFVQQSLAPASQLLFVAGEELVAWTNGDATAAPSHCHRLAPGFISLYLGLRRAKAECSLIAFRSPNCAVSDS